MAMILQLASFGHQYFYGTTKAVSTKNGNALRMGVLSTALINNAAVINPIASHPDIILSAVASRSKEGAEKYAKTHHIPKAYRSYEELLAEPGIDCVYIPLPNGMHFEWAMKSLQAGKHVLLEKPFVSNAEQARKLVELAVSKGLILEEAFHYQFHPVNHRFAELVKNKEYGKVIKTYSRMTSPSGSIPKSDIRWQYDLAGGCLMDFTYTVSTTRYFLDAGVPKEVRWAEAVPDEDDGRIDKRMRAVMTFEHDGYDVESEIYADMAEDLLYGFIPQLWHLPLFKVEMEHATLTLNNFMFAHLYHIIKIEDKRTGKTSYEKHYTGGKWGAERGESTWSTYRWQLEAFVDKIRGKQPPHWIELQSSIDQMQTIDMIYEKAGLPLRPNTEAN